MATTNGKTGPKLIAETADELEKKISFYWARIKKTKEPPTITGLAYYLGFASRQSFYDYERRPEFTHTIQRARLRIESQYEKGLFTARNAAGPIFGLKNFGWRDEQSINIQAARDTTAALFPQSLKDLGKDEPTNPTDPAGNPG